MVGLIAEFDVPSALAFGGVGIVAAVTAKMAFESDMAIRELDRRIEELTVLERERVTDRDETTNPIRELDRRIVELAVFEHARVTDLADRVDAMEDRIRFSRGEGD